MSLPVASDRDARLALLPLSVSPAGCSVHILAVTFGLASLLTAVPTAYEIVEYAGAAYLIYLGMRILISRQQKNTETPIKEAGLRTIFLQGAITNVLNPKVALFSLAFLPQFVNRDGNFAAQIIFLGILFNVSGTMVNIIVALSQLHGRSVQNSHWQLSGILMVDRRYFHRAWCSSRVS